MICTIDQPRGAHLCREEGENTLSREHCSGTEGQSLSVARLCLVPLQLVPRKSHTAKLQLSAQKLKAHSHQLKETNN